MTPCFQAIDTYKRSGYALGLTLPRRDTGRHQVQRNPSNPVTELLVRWRGGDREALDALMPLVYSELRGVAHRYLQNDRSAHTLQSTALVNEAHVRMVTQ